MEFKVDDWVVHPQHGVGKVVKLELRQFGSGTEELYYEISIPDGTFWAKVEGASCGLRRVTTKADLVKYRDLLKSRPAPLNENHRQRQIEIAERMRQGAFRDRCEVVRDLSALGWYKPLGEGSATLLRHAYHVLYEEWSMAQGVSLSEATREVETLLQEGKLLYKD
jgi:RNA polymerase-interacting CarD/CdnL/TRCF family regulator